MKRTLGRVGRGTVTALCAASLFMPRASAAQALPFEDISNSYARNEIIDLYNQKILTGTSTTRFSPSKSMTRAEFLTSLDRLLKLEPVASPISPYADVPQNAWYYGWIQAAVQLELASGVSAKFFAPAKAVTRQEAAVWLAKALKKAAGTASVSTAFEDGRDIAAWASSAVAAVYRLGLMKGDETGNFRPSDPITRQEAAVLLDRVLQHKGWAAELAARPKERIVIGWKYGQTTVQYENNILKSNVNTLSPRWYFVGSTGAVTDSTDTGLITWAKKKGTNIWAMVGNRSDQAATHRMLSSAATRNTAVNGLAAMAKKYGLDGLNLDFENVAPQDRTALTTFVTLLAEKLHANQQILSVDVSPDLDTDWTEAFDYGALGLQADYMVLMGYDEHYSGSAVPGPNASLPYVQKAVNKILQVVPSEKVILALPFYNRDWTLQQTGAALSSEFISFTEQNQRMQRYSMKPVWDASLGQYVASYTTQSIKHTIWLEEGRSLIAKYHLAVKQNLAGVAYWYIGGESADIWTSLGNAEKYYDYSF
ncbi:hypothetical protein GCM10010912_45800 [Paenibacillus albidus]|uniref:Glycoside hydrolase n=1 Tax=Paenibacillus albidus TaxID=2041023 RepID=A0A917CQP8_9BACL|nr:S-layer homology domain-containing protein [Paenibacillus albidus]GGF95696.1 hypothetical protein GCM10010912_45800 [Paenibacillus albidus]